MNGKDVYDVLLSRGVSRLFHANSVATSLSLLKLKGLASRGAVERARLPQTWQYTDDLDRQFGVWDDIFMDTIDIHSRISDRNKYGPVLFEVDVSILINLPETSQVFITKMNPSRWGSTQSVSERYFMDKNELNNGLSIGTFDQMLTVRTPGGVLPFGKNLKKIILDEQRNSQGVGQEYRNAESALNEAATNSGIEVGFVQRGCNYCSCIRSYAEQQNRISRFFDLS